MITHSYVEFQRKQRMVVSMHKNALQAMCNFWWVLIRMQSRQSPDQHAYYLSPPAGHSLAQSLGPAGTAVGCRLWAAFLL